MESMERMERIAFHAFQCIPRGMESLYKEGLMSGQIGALHAQLK
jgi:hypothetical protein